MHVNLCKSNLHVLLEANGPLVLMAYTKITSTAHTPIHMLLNLVVLTKWNNNYVYLHGHSCVRQ